VNSKPANQILIETQPARQDVDFIEDQLNAYNIAQTGVPFGGELACFVRNEQGEIVAGLYGYTWGDCCQIEVLWVHASLRGQSYGTRLLQAAEQEAAHRGCTVSVLDTHSFQSPGFYQKLGYEIVGAIDNYPQPQHQVIYLKKRLDSGASLV
jgi:ribosomal protein S18 acetylase RimI-like enzyme